MSKYFKLIFNLFFAFAVLVASSQSPLYAQNVPQTGVYKTKHANGKTAEKGYFKNGQKHRTWSFFNENGAITQKEKWKNGKMLWQVFYNERGRIIKIIDKDGKVKELSGCGC